MATQKKSTTRKEGVAPKQLVKGAAEYKNTMKTQIYLCVDLKALTHDAHMEKGRGRIGMLTMTDRDERFEFCESRRRKDSRNPKVWTGDRLNVSLQPDGRYMITLRRLELSGSTDPLRIADEIFVELEQAKKELGL